MEENVWVIKSLKSNNKMAILAIKGHATRGKEVIEILEMLGGKKEFVVNGNTSSKYRYYIDSDKMINVFTVGNEDLKYEYITFTLEEFLEKFPYRVGDRVKIPNCDVACRVTKMIWNDIEIEYETTNSEEAFFADELQPYKKETMKDYLVTEEDYGKALEVEQEYIDAAERLMDQLAEGTHWKCKDFDSQKMIALFLKKNTSIITEKENSIIVDIPKGYEFSGVDDDNQQVVFERIVCQYPKTYEECCKVLNICPNGDIVYAGNWVYGGEYLEKHLERIRNFQKLLICRNAYWKIAGEQMGLGKPWEPDFTNNDEERYSIYTLANKVERDFCGVGDVNTILVFPTEEMRDAFSDSKEIAQLIENCKEFL